MLYTRPSIGLYYYWEATHRPQRRGDGDFSRMVWYKAAMSSLLGGGAESAEEPWDRQVSSRGGRTAVRCRCGNALKPYPIWHLVSGIKLVPVVPGNTSYHEGVPPVYFLLGLAVELKHKILACTRESWRYSSNGFRSYTAVKHCEPLLCVLTLPMRRLGCRILTRHLFMVRPSYRGTAQRRYYLGST